MKIKRFAVLTAGLLLVTGYSADAGKVVIKLPGVTATLETSSTKLAHAVAQQVQRVQERLATNRLALRTTPGPGGTPAYLPREVTGLIVHTREDLDQALQQIGEPRLAALSAWSDEEFRRIQTELPPPGPTASLSGPSAPRAFAVFASSRGFGLPVFAKNKLAPKKPKPPAAPKAPEPPKPQTIPASTTDRLLDEVAQVIDQIFVLAKNDKLEVDLWVGSTPAEKAKFSFWPQGNFKGSTPAPLIIDTDGRRKHIVRGLYYYSAAWGKGAVIQHIKYPDPDATLASERLDLVKGSRFFCCQFDKTYCHHVDDEKNCH
jgi:hypothetical protein